MQLTTAKNTETTEDEYLDVMRAKTAVLFSAAAEVGAIVAGAERSVRAAFRSYGANLGIAFQLIDDALDYGGQTPTLGKDVGDDFREGKVTLPVVLAYRRGTRRGPRVLEAHAGRRATIGEDDLARAVALLERTTRAEGHGRARPPLRRDGARCAGAAARRAVQGGAAAGGGVLHRPRTLT